MGTEPVIVTPSTENPQQDAVIAAPNPTPAPAPVITTPPPIAPTPPASAPPPIVEIYDIPIEPTPHKPPPYKPGVNAVASLPHWRGSDVTPALQAFARSCKRWQKAKPTAYLNDGLSEYGQYRDWAQVCTIAKTTAVDFASAHDFFEQYFTPVNLAPRNSETGLMTGYYQPEIEVRRVADAYYNEPVLAVPKDAATRKLPRAKIGAKTSRVIAYGRPMDVFFMQIQGSGHLRYSDGTVLRAAYDGNNGKPYRSIGKLLIERGELSKHRSAKRDIEAWMAANGPEKSRALMNDNPRYIFFTEQKIELGEGPMGGMRVPLTAMGSMAVDPRYHPYGSLVWLEVKLPQYAGDYKATQSGLLLAAQDTGKAIRGAMRGDIYFGSGAEAGALAGVMKHRAKWMTLLPKALAERVKNASAGTS